MQRTLTDVENNEVRHWNVQHVLLWLKHTSNGLFEEYCPIFQENHVHGEALLSLNNEILRDEFEIKSYGKRFELLKAIQKLAKKASTSKGSLSNSIDGRRISRTYYKGMSSNKNKNIKGISNDNWENLDVIASNTNLLNQKEYTKVIGDVVNEVTGTEISKQTREKHSFYRKLSNLTTKNTTNNTQKIGSTASKCGGYEFDITMPNWDLVPITKVYQHKWDEILHQWINKIIYVKIAPLPFGRGSLRMSYYCLNFGDDINKINKNLKQNIKQSKNNKNNMNEMVDEKNDTLTNNNILFNKLIGNKNVFGGKLCVAKKNFGICDSIEAYFYDVRTQCESAKYAKEYNRHNPPKKVAFLQASVIEVIGNNPNTTDPKSVEFYCLESFLHGSYIKHIDNHGGDEKNRNTPSAFAHFSYVCSNKRLLVCDIQGVGDLYTDPQIHTIHGNGFGMGNLGNDGIIKFFKTHECNAICKHFKFSSTSYTGGINPDLIYGTRPDKQYMRKKKIDVIDTKYIDDIPYLMKLPILWHKKIKVNTSDDILYEDQTSIVNVSNQTNINININKINNNKNIKEEKQRLLDGCNPEYNDNYQPLPPKDAESGCCACNCAIL